jgi:hypothetical protein
MPRTIQSSSTSTGDVMIQECDECEQSGSAMVYDEEREGRVIGKCPTCRGMGWIFCPDDISEQP